MHPKKRTLVWIVLLGGAAVLVSILVPSALWLPLTSAMVQQPKVMNTDHKSFLLEHEATLRANPRLGGSVLGLCYLDEKERLAIHRQARSFLDTLHCRERKQPCNFQP